MTAVNGWCRWAGSFACFVALEMGCSARSSHGSSGEIEHAGTNMGGDGAGQTERPGRGGNEPAGGSAGRPEGGSPSAGSVSGGGAGVGGEAPAASYRAVVGELCPVEATIGVVELWRGSPHSVRVTLYDRPDPWVTQAALTTPTCAFHAYRPSACAGCSEGEVCSVLGPCVTERRTIENAVLEVSVGTEKRRYWADPMLGGIHSTVDIGDEYSRFAMTLSWNETQIVLAAMPAASGQLDDLAIQTESLELDMPGALDASWDPPGDEAFVRSRIPINHRAGGPTFTECRVPSNMGAFHADSGMIDPLAVPTGLEFQTVDHVFIAAARTPQGCVEFRFGTQVYAVPNMP